MSHNPQKMTASLPDEIIPSSTDSSASALYDEKAPVLHLFQNIAEEVADGIYVVNQENHALLYVDKRNTNILSDIPDLPPDYKNRKEEPKCYRLLYGKSSPCEFCPLQNISPKQKITKINFENNGHSFTASFRKIDWNHLPAYSVYICDITEEIKKHLEQERLEQYFQTVIKYLPGGMAVIHHSVLGESKPEYLSDGFANMLSISQKEAWDMYRDDALSGVHPDDRKYVQAQLQKCIQERTEKYELQYRLRNGLNGYTWVSAKFSVIPCEDKSTRVYVNYHDITMQKEMQDKLQQQYNEQIKRHYLLASPNALILGHCNVTQNKIYEIVDYTNSALLETFGNVREDFFTGIGTLIVDEAERKEFYSKYLNEPSKQAYLNGTSEIIMSCFLKLPHQELGKYVQFKVTLIDTPDTGDITGILVITDITEKVIREKIFMTLSSSNYDLVANVNLFSDTYEIVSGGDKHIPEKRGSNSQRVKRVLSESVMHREQEKKYLEKMLDPSSMLKRLEQKNQYSFLYSLYNEKGEVRTKSMLISAIDLRLGRVCFIRSDVTDMLKAEQKAKEELVKALKEAQNANQVKSDFLASMSHDIRTPMNAIVGMTNLALANIENTDKIKDYLYKISVSSQHLLSLINDILDMRQIEQSKIHLNYQMIHIQELIDHLSSMMSTSAKNAGLHFHIDNQCFTSLAFMGDSLRIKQILINLLSNAFKFTPNGGTVLFRIEEIDAKQPQNVRYRFTVKDNGIGMNKDFMKRLFDPFMRNTNASKLEGTGLGLSITKGLVDLMGGSIHVDSQLKKGTTFEVELEFEKIDDVKIDSAETTSNIVSKDLSGYHFLLVEDNEINYEILSELLHMWGATVTIKTDGLQAVNEFKQAKPGTYDAIFMDIQMPVMNGYEATKKIRKLDHPDAKSIIILAMTANAFTEDIYASLDAGMDGHIAKPIDMELLYDTLSSMLNKKKNKKETH